MSQYLNLRPDSGEDAPELAAMLEAFEVYVRCVEDTLLDRRGLAFQRVQEPLEDGSLDPTCVTFYLDCNPVHDLSVTIQLRPDVLQIRANLVQYQIRRKPKQDVVDWVEGQCRRLEDLFGRHLKIEQTRFLGIPVQSELKAGDGSEFKSICKITNGMLTTIGYVMPFGFVLFVEKKLQFEDWWVADWDEFLAGAIGGGGWQAAGGDGSVGLDELGDPDVGSDASAG